MPRAIPSSALALSLCLLCAPAGAERNPALAGQSVTAEVDGGTRTREYARNGQLIYETIERSVPAPGRAAPAIEAWEREWQDDGSPLREQHFVAGSEVEGKAWYLNGQLKESRVDQSLREPGGIAGVYVERYSDLGRLQSAGVYRGSFRPVGTHREYDAQGALAREVDYDEHGRKTAERAYAADGSVRESAGYLPDGSRRLR